MNKTEGVLMAFSHCFLFLLYLVFFLHSISSKKMIIKKMIIKEIIILCLSYLLNKIILLLSVLYKFFFISLENQKSRLNYLENMIKSQ